MYHSSLTPEARALLAKAELEQERVKGLVPFFSFSIMGFSRSAINQVLEFFSKQGKVVRRSANSMYVND